MLRGEGWCRVAHLGKVKSPRHDNSDRCMAAFPPGRQSGVVSPHLHTA